MGMAVHNPTPDANALALSVVDAAGAALEEAAIGEPLAARGQLARSVCELIDCRHLNDDAAVIARGRQGHVQSFFLAGDPAGKKLDGVSGEFETAQQLYFPIVDPGRHDATLLFVFNPTLRETAVTFTLYREDGGMVAGDPRGGRRRLRERDGRRAVRRRRRQRAGLCASAGRELAVGIRVPGG